MTKPITYRECKTLEDFARFDAEIKAEDEVYARAAKFDEEKYAEWAKTQTPEQLAAAAEEEDESEILRKAGLNRGRP